MKRGSTDEGVPLVDGAAGLDQCAAGLSRHLQSVDDVHVGLGARHRNLGASDFDPAAVGNVRIRLLDGADTWKSWTWEDRP